MWATGTVDRNDAATRALADDADGALMDAVIAELEVRRGEPGVPDEGLMALLGDKQRLRALLGTFPGVNPDDPRFDRAPAARQHRRSARPKIESHPAATL